MVGELGQRLCGPDAHADRQPDPLGNPLPDLLPIGHQVALADAGHAFEAQERLIDAVNLQLGCEVAQDVDHPVAHRGVQLVVGGQGDDAVPFGLLPQLEPRGAHWHPQCFGFFAASNDTAVVVAQDDDRPVPKLGLP